MAKQAVRDAVTARLAANWTLSTILTLNVDTIYPTDGSPWIRLEFPLAGENTLTSLGRTMREMNSFRIVVATEIESGYTKSYTWCETIAQLFSRQFFSNVFTYEPTIHEGVDEGLYFVASVIVPYRYEYTT